MTKTKEIKWWPTRKVRAVAGRFCVFNEEDGAVEFLVGHDGRGQSTREGYGDYRRGPDDQPYQRRRQCSLNTISFHLK